MTSLLGRVFDAVSSFSGRKKVTESVAEENTSQQGDMATTTEKSNPKKRLFEEDDDEDTATKAPEQDLSFKIDKEFARKYEHNKKREEKQKLEEKYGKTAAGAEEDNEDSSDDEDEDEAGYLLTDDLDARMTAALAAIKNKDPRIYDPQTKFFDPAEIDKIGEETAQAKPSEPKQKPMFLRDYHRERYLSGDVGAEDDDDAEAGGAKILPKTYQQEQDAAKKALVDALNAADDSDEEAADDKDDDDDDVDAFIKPKAGKKSAGDAPAPHPKITEADVANADKNPELFLSNFLAARAWVPEDDETGPGWRAFESDDDEGAEESRAEAFEVAYNMRFEDPNASNEVLKSYARDAVQAQSVRREQKTARQRQRDQEKERLAAEKRERHEERARLRKLRIEEAQRKLAQIKQAAGIRGDKVLSEDAWTELLDGAWDTEKWEARMREQFGDGYYEDADAGRESEEDAEDKSKKSKKPKKPKKPKWDDDIDIKDIIPEFDDGVPKVSLSDLEEASEAGEEQEGEEPKDEDDDEEDDEEHPSKRRKTGKDRKQERADAKRQARRERARIEALVNRQMELEAPSALAGSASTAGFRYRETSPQSFGLTARDILLAPSDAALNDFAGLKKLATFRDEERKRKDRKTLGKKARLRQWRRETFGAEFEKTGPTYGFERVVGETTASQKQTSHKKSKDKGKGKVEEEEVKEADGESSGRKRKRSGRKGGKDKKKEKPAAQEA